MISDVFIDRPRLFIVISVVLTIAGLITAVLWCFMSGIVLIVLTDMLMSL